MMVEPLPFIKGAKRKHLLLSNAPSGKLCWDCKHIDFIAGDPGYSEYTPGNDFHLECSKNMWEFDNYGDQLSDFRQKLEVANVCGLFEEREK